MAWKFAETRNVVKTFATAASTVATPWTPESDEMYIIKYAQITNTAGDRQYDQVYVRDRYQISCLVFTQTQAATLYIKPEHIPGGIVLGPGETLRVSIGNGGAADGTGQLNARADVYKWVP